MIYEPENYYCYRPTFDLATACMMIVLMRHNTMHRTWNDFDSLHYNIGSIGEHEFFRLLPLADKSSKDEHHENTVERLRNPISPFARRRLSHNLPKVRLPTRDYERLPPVRLLTPAMTKTTTMKIRKRAPCVQCDNGRSEDNFKDPSTMANKNTRAWCARSRQRT